MTRRYLTTKEAGSVLRRGKAVEIFLGGFDFEGEKCIRWASFTASGDKVSASLWEAFDQGSEDYIDIYTFDSPSGEYGEPVKMVTSKSIESAANQLGIKELKLVNSGVIQDEYNSYFKSHT
ncbi:hypothetical protein [uncultured Pseudoteredinibacter sp.]|uniref:hypothetical protein n=1 Tax=uncultured Pseudoteredinibacter sp. TaxID=1641701 RepID=UPI0026169990|nr:hypothetical protein [uncultured Pseudoteredinibacter sp.]